MKFEDRIKELRQEKNITLTDLGAAFKKAESACRSWEMGRSKPGADTIIKLSKYFDCSTDYLLGLSEARHLSESEKDAQIIAMKEKIARLEATIKEIAAICNANPQEV